MPRITSSTSQPLPSDDLATHLHLVTLNVIDLTNYIEKGSYIGYGGFGDVYKCKLKYNLTSMPILGASPHVALKVIKVPPLADEEKKKKIFKSIRRELEIWRNLKHQSILPMIGFAYFDRDTNLPAFVSPWMDHGNVREFLQQNPFFPAIPFLLDVIKGLSYLHKFNPPVVHGDIKGANILISRYKKAYICDFGLSRIPVDNSLWRTSATHACGTLRWMAPELVEQEERLHTKASDIYAYGMTCYEMLSGKVPFELVLNSFRIKSQIMDRVRPERVDSCHCPDELWTIIHRCWAQRAGDRPSTESVLRSMRRVVLQYREFLLRVLRCRNLSTRISHNLTVVKTPALLDEELRMLTHKFNLWSQSKYGNGPPVIGIAFFGGVGTVTNNIPASISPCIDHRNLCEFLKTNPFFLAIKFVRDIIKGVYYLNTFRPGIVHRNIIIKVENILVNHRNEAYLCGFSRGPSIHGDASWKNSSPTDLEKSDQLETELEQIPLEEFFSVESPVCVRRRPSLHCQMRPTIFLVTRVEPEAKVVLVYDKDWCNSYPEDFGSYSQNLKIKYFLITIANPCLAAIDQKGRALLTTGKSTIDSHQAENARIAPEPGLTIDLALAGGEHPEDAQSSPSEQGTELNPQTRSDMSQRLSVAQQNHGKALQPSDQRKGLRLPHKAIMTLKTERAFRARPRLQILVIGRPGAGKYSLLNTIFKTSLRHVQSHKAGTPDINLEYTSEYIECFVLQWDESKFQVLENFIKAGTQPDTPIGERLHAIWLCMSSVPQASGRVFERGEDKILKIERGKVPIIVVFTKFDRLAALAGLREGGSFIAEDTIRILAEKTFEETCAAPLKELLTGDIPAEIPFLPVSIHQIETLQNLVNVTNIQIEPQGSSKNARVGTKAKSLPPPNKQFSLKVAAKDIKHAKLEDSIRAMAQLVDGNREPEKIAA